MPLTLLFYSFFRFTAALAAVTPIDHVCQMQIEAHDVPVACFQRVLSVKDQERQKFLLEILDHQCLAALQKESRLEQLQNLAKHPAITEECRKAANERLLKVQYRKQDSQPWEVIKSLIEAE